MFKSSMILFGEFDLDDASNYQKICALTQGVILITIVMNTLVGLMNEVFGDLKTHFEERDAKEVNWIIYSLEIFLI